MTDLRPPRSWIALWLAALSLEALLIVAPDRMPRVQSAVWLLQAVALAAIVMRLARRDGSTPLRRVLLLLGLIGVVPLTALEMLRVAHAGVTVAALGLVLPEIAVRKLLLVLSVAVPAALSRSVLGFVTMGLCLATIAVMSWVIAGLGAALVVDVSRLVGMNVGMAPRSPSSTAMLLLTLVAAFVVVLAAQNARRSRWRSLAVAALGLVLASEVGFFWRLPFVGDAGCGFGADGARIARALQVSLAPDVETGRTRPESDPRAVHARVQVDGVPARYGAHVEVSWSELTFPDGHVITFRRASPPSGWDAGAVARTLDATWTDPHATFATVTLGMLSESEHARYAVTPARLRARVFVVVHRHDVATMPPTLHARLDRGTLRSEVTHVSTAPGSIDVEVEERRVAALLGGCAGRSRNVLYLLRNRSGREALWPEAGGFFSSRTPGSFLPRVGDTVRGETSPVMLENALYWRSVEVTAVELRYKPGATIDDVWLAAADVVRLEAPEIGMAARLLEADDFTAGRP